MSGQLPEAVGDYLALGRTRFHMPGHKGRGDGIWRHILPYDITEVEGTDSLYEASGAIAGTEREFARLYGTCASFLSAGGSTLCIQAMLALAAAPGSKIIAGRGVHTAAVNAMALLDLQPVWVYPSGDGGTGLFGTPGPRDIRKALQAHADAAAVYVTSPNYLGVLCDLPAISAICREHGVPLLVDNAHGAHLKFLTPSLHPMDLGADLCCDSLHKTLPVLTGGALLHVRDGKYAGNARRMLSMFGSTSPSYLVMLSAAQAIPWLEGDGPAHLREIGRELARIKGAVRARGFPVPGGNGDPLRLSLGFREAGYSPGAFGQYVRAAGIEPEYLGHGFCVFLSGAGTVRGDLDHLEQMLLTMPVRPVAVAGGAPLARPRQAMGLRQAAFAPRREVPVEEAVGCVAAGMVAPCPPGIPLVLGGELVDGDMVRRLKEYGIFYINVVQ